LVEKNGTRISEKVFGIMGTIQLLDFSHLSTIVFCHSDFILLKTIRSVLSEQLMYWTIYK